MAIIAWQAWFVDVPIQGGVRRFNSAETAPEELPKDGCLAILAYYDTQAPGGEHLRFNYLSSDYYFFAYSNRGLILGSDNDRRESNVPGEIRSRYVDVTICRGVWTDDDTMAKVSEEMANAVELP